MAPWNGPNDRSLQPKLQPIDGFRYVRLALTNLTVRRLSGVHLVDTDNQLLHTEGEREKGVFASLAVLGDACLELASASSHDEHSTVRLWQQLFHRLITVLQWFKFNSTFSIIYAILYLSDINFMTEIASL